MSAKKPGRMITPGEADRFLGRPKLEETLSEVIVEGLSSLVVDFFELYDFDVGLALELIRQPVSMLRSLGAAALEKLRMRDSEYAAGLGGLNMRFRNLPDETGIREIRAEHISRLIQVSGIVTKATAVKPLLTKAAFRCRTCGEVFLQDVVGNVEHPSACPACNRRRGFEIHPDECEYGNIQLLTIQERPEQLPPGQLPHNMGVKLTEDLVGSANPGDRVKATCIVSVQMRNKTSPVVDIYLGANHVEPIGRGLEALEVTPQDEARIRELAADPWIYRKIIRSIAPQLYGLEQVKEAIALQQFGGVPKERGGMHIRGDVNAFLIGDPGTGKSQLLQYAARVSPRGLYTTGRGSTAAGLTAAAVREKDGAFTLEAGALVLADRGTCCIDELEKMRAEDRIAIHPAMEQQIVSIAKGGINAELNARASILAAANPALGRYNTYQNVAQNINLPITLLNRFDLIFVIQDVPDPERDQKMARHVLSLHADPDYERSPIPPALLRKYISYAKRLTPRMPNEVRETLEAFFLETRRASFELGEAAAIMITIRQLESLVRLAEARARLHLRGEVLPEDAEAAIALTRYSLEQVGIDVATGKVDVDVIMTGKPRSMQMKLQKVLGVISEMGRATGVVKDDDVYSALEEKGIPRSEAARLIGTLSRDGTIFSPRPGFYKRTSS